MDDINENLNRSINHALRSVNYIAVELARSECEERSENIKKIASVLELLADVQRTIYKVRPDLEYHYDNERAPTEYMVQFRNHLLAARKLEESGKIPEALEELRLALAMEPPPLPHERLVAEIKRVAESAS